MYYCPNCGAQVSQGASFCNACGEKIDEAGSPVTEFAVPSGAPGSAGRSGGAATASLVLGVVAVVLSLVTCLPVVFWCSFLEPLVAIIAIVLGIVGRSGAGEADRSKTTWGISLGIVATVVWITLLILGLVFGIGVLVLSETMQ